MSVSGISASAVNVSQAKTADAAQLLVLKKTMDINAQSALQLIQAASDIIPRNPAHLGNKIDVMA